MIPDTPQTLLRKIAEYANGDDSAEAAEPAVQPASAPAADLTPPSSLQEAPKREREIQKIPPLYID